MTGGKNVFWLPFAYIVFIISINFNTSVKVGAFTTGSAKGERNANADSSLSSSSSSLTDNNEACSARTTTARQNKNHRTEEKHKTKSKRKNRCPPLDGDSESDEKMFELDRREAAFAMLGNIWAVTGISLLPESVWPGGVSLGVEPAYAVYGADANMDFPNVMEGLADRNNKQCLVESLGNRECLVYAASPDEMLYNGADIELLLSKIRTSIVVLNTVPDLVAMKKWSSVTSILTGPMGELSRTMIELIKLKASNDKLSEALSQAQKDVKNDIFAIGAAADKKQGDAIIKYTGSALQNLATFVKLIQQA